MSQIANDRVPNDPLITTTQGGLGAPPDFIRSAPSVTTTQTGHPIGEAFTPANATGDTLVSSELQQKSTQERIIVQTRVDYTGLNITSQETDPTSGVPVQVTKSIVPSIGGVSSVTIGAGGSGYTAATATGTTPSGGLPAKYGAPVISGGAVISIPILDPGSGRVVNDTITITGDGTGASATGVIPSYPSIDTNGRYIDIIPIDKWKSVQFASRCPLDQSGLDALAVTIPGRRAFPWPRTLASLTLYRDLGTHVNAPTGTFHSVTIGGGYQYSGGVGKSFIEGPQSEVVASLRRTFWKGTPTISETITKIQTVSGVVVVQGGADSVFTTYSVDDSTSGVSVDTSHSNNFSVVAIEPCLSNGVGLGTTGSGQAVGHLVMGVSSPVAFAAGDLVVTDIAVTQWRFNIYVKEVLTLTFPS